MQRSLRLAKKKQQPAETLIRTDPYLLRCLLVAFVIWNISNRAFPNTGFRILRILVGAGNAGVSDSFHRRRCAATLRSSTGEGSMLGRRPAISRSAFIMGERLTPPTQWISSFPFRTPSAIAAMTALNCRTEIGRESGIGTQV